MLLCNRCRDPISKESMVAKVQVHGRGGHITYYHWPCRPTGVTTGMMRGATVLRSIETMTTPAYRRR